MSRGIELLLVALTACASAEPLPVTSTTLSEPPFRLTLTILDDRGAPAQGSSVRIAECCHTDRGPCGRVPLDADGRVAVDVCPAEDRIVHVTVTPDPRAYRVAPISEVEVRRDTAVTLTITRHAASLERLRAR